MLDKKLILSLNLGYSTFKNHSWAFSTYRLFIELIISQFFTLNVINCKNKQQQQQQNDQIIVLFQYAPVGCTDLFERRKMAAGFLQNRGGRFLSSV